MSEADAEAITRVREDLESAAREWFRVGGDAAPRPVQGALIVNLRNILEAMDAVAEAQPVRVATRPAAALDGRPQEHRLGRASVLGAGAPRCARPPHRPAAHRARARCLRGRPRARSPRRARAGAGRRPGAPTPSRRSSALAATESMPSRLTLRRMNGSTVVASPVPAVRPLTRDGAAVARGAQGVGGGRAADRVDGRGPARLLQRTVRLGGRLLARDDLVRAEAAQVVVLGGLAGRCPHLVAGAGERADRGAADAAAGAEDEHGAVGRGETVGLQRVDRQAGGEPGGAERPWPRAARGRRAAPRPSRRGRARSAPSRRGGRRRGRSR